MTGKLKKATVSEIFPGASQLPPPPRATVKKLDISGIGMSYTGTDEEVEHGLMFSQVGSDLYKLCEYGLLLRQEQEHDALS